jgi:non-specific serine/threonine protein kinase
MIGQTVGPYRIDAPLGSGGMGVVYRGTDTRLDRPVALKFLPAAAAHDRQSLERFHREARLVASLNHPGICTLHDIGEHEGQAYLVMELLDGSTLHDRLGGRARPIDEVIAVGVQLADALGAAHQRGIVHRDLKPANIIITAHGHAKILDFGVATLSADHAAETLHTATRLTGAGQAVGTLAYMAPEQLRGELADQRADLFAIGLVLYEMASGKAAFGGVTSGVMIDAVLNRPPAPLRSINPAVPARLEDVIVKLLEKDPELRYQHAADLRADLKRLQRDTSHAIEPAPPTAKPLARPAGVPSIAILPFADLSPGKDQQYFCEGMADEIMTALSSLGDIRVASRTSAVRCREKGMDLAEIGQRLNVETVLDGSVRKAGNRLRISAHLTKVQDGFQLWAERYDRDLDDVFAVQDEIARAIADRLRVKLTSGTDQAVERGTENLDAYNLYLQGRYHWARRNRWQLGIALESFTRAVELDPSYAHAHAGIADCYTALAVYSVRPAASFRATGSAAAEQAILLAPSLAEAHHSCGGVRAFLYWDTKGAEEALRAAVALNPRLTISHAYLGVLLMAQGRTQEAIEFMERALSLEPDSALIAYMASSIFVWSRQYQRSLDLARRSLALEPDAPYANSIHSLALTFLGRIDEAVRAAEHGVERGERLPMLLTALGQVYAAAGREADADAVLAELTERSTHEYIAPIYFLDVHAALGRRDEASLWLERAIDDGNGLFLRAGVSPEYDRIRDDPRFQALLARAGLATP